MYVPEIHKQRKKISGLKMPRAYTPRLPGASTKGQAPINPFSGNKMKVASLSSFREARLIKTASAEDAHLYSEMCKLADTGDELQIRMFLAQHPEMEKDAGIVGHGFRLLSKALGKGGQMTGSAKMTQMAGQAAKKSQARFAQAATKSQGRVVAMEEGVRGASGGRLVNEMAKADKFKALAGQQKTWATTHGRAAGKQIAAKKPPVPVKTPPVKTAPAGTPATGTPAGTAPTGTPPVKTPATGAPAGAPAGGTPPVKTAPAGGAQFTNMSDDALKAAAEGGDEAAKIALAKRLGNPVEAAASPLIANSTLGKAIVGTAAVGTAGAVGYGGYKGVQSANQQNAQQAQRGFNYGVR